MNRQGNESSKLKVQMTNQCQSPNDKAMTATRLPFDIGHLDLIRHLDLGIWISPLHALVLGILICLHVSFAQGPDQGGYRWIDSDTSAGPTFQWVDIAGSGTSIVLGDDDNKGPFALGFSFSFYGTDRDSIRVCSNGWLSFTSNSHQFHYHPIPDPHDPNALIAPLWADLDPSAGGSVYYFADTIQKRFIISWVGVPFHGTNDSCTFQAILDTSGTILFQYLKLPDHIWDKPPGSSQKADAIPKETHSATEHHFDFCTLHFDFEDDSCSVGIENDAGLVGLEYFHAGEPPENRLHDSLATRFYQLDQDVCPKAIGRPFEQELAGSSIVPVVTIWNPGTSPASFPATLKIGQGYQEQITVADLNPLCDTMLEFPAWTVGADTYRLELFTTLAGDQFPANDTIRSQTFGSEAGELRYDDGKPDTWFLRIGSPTMDWAAAVRFTSPYSEYRLLGARLFVLDTSPFQRVLVCPDDGGEPDLDNPFFQVESVAAAQPETWLELDTDTLLSSEELWLLAFWPRRADGPSIGDDRTRPIDHRSYFGSPSVRWIPHNDGDLLARLRIDGRTGITELEPVTKPQISLRPNPFKHRLKIRVTPLRCAGCHPLVQVSGRIYNASGRAVRSFALQTDREWVWDGRNQKGMPVPQGVYTIVVDGAPINHTKVVKLK